MDGTGQIKLAADKSLLNKDIKIAFPDGISEKIAESKADVFIFRGKDIKGNDCLYGVYKL